MITEEILNRFKNNLLNEEIPLPKGTKSAKIVCHADLDGLISGITMVHQLKKQGIPKERIKVEIAQYGDENKEGHKHTEKFIGRKNEFVGVTDFANLPKAKPYQLMTDIIGSKPDKIKAADFINLKDSNRNSIFKNMTFDEFKRLFKSKFKVENEQNLNSLYEVLKSFGSLTKEPGLNVAKSYNSFKILIDGKLTKNGEKITDDKAIRGLFKKFLQKNNFENSSINEFLKALKSEFPEINTSDSRHVNSLFKYVKEFYRTWTGYRVTPDNVEKLNLQTVNPDFVSDHHDNVSGSLSGGKTGEIAVNSPSEAEFLSKKYSPGMWSQDDIKAVSMVDSAGYDPKQLENTIFLEKHFTGPNKKKNLATILATIYDAMVKKDREAAKWVILNSEPSLVSAYNNTLKVSKFSGKRLKYLELLRNGKVEEAKEILNEIPDILNKGYDRHNEPKDKIMSREDWVAKNRHDLANAKAGPRTPEEDKEYKRLVYKMNKEINLGYNPERAATKQSIADRLDKLYKNGKIRVRDNFTIFDGTEWETQYSRYTTSLFSVNGMRSPYTMRYWNGFFQVAKNSLYKGKVNWSDISDHVLDDVEKFLNNKLDKNRAKEIVDYMREKSGGHADSIWSIQGFDKIAPSEEEKKKYNFKKYDLAKKLYKKYNSELGKNIKKEYDGSYRSIVRTYYRIKDECLKYAIDRTIYWTNKLYPVDKTKLDALKNTDERFEGKAK